MLDLLALRLLFSSILVTLNRYHRSTAARAVPPVAIGTGFQLWGSDTDLSYSSTAISVVRGF